MTGVKPTQTGGMYMLSTGNQSLDAAIGGGLIVGSLNVVFEDCLSHFYTHF